MDMSAQFKIDQEVGQPVDPRQGKRLKVFLAARVLAAGRTVPVHLLDLSKKGALVHADMPRMPGEMIWVLWNGIDILSRVAWCRGNRFGVAFETSLSDGQIAQMVAATGAPRLTAARRSGRRDWLRWFRK
ncbi:PilZ domain-containing protein [Sphingomonas crocodyli]|nr:PilZ domain-containing protein [Sphingomonas crocodyli]